MTQFANQQKGYVANMQSTQLPHSQHQVTMSLRIPENALPATLSHFESLGKLVNFSQSGVDVTRQYQNLASQKATLNDELTAYQALFKKAGSMKDMLEIQQALSQVQAKLQQTAQSTAQLKHNVHYAVLNITLFPVALPSRPSPHGFADALVLSLKAMRHIGYLSLLALGFIAPWFVLLAFAVGIARSLKSLWKRARN